MKANASIRLTSQEIRFLREVAKCDPSTRARHRALALLMSGQGDTQEKISDTLGVCRSFVVGARNRWRRNGPEGLHDAARSGRPSRTAGRYTALLLRTVEKPPPSLGFAFGRWTCRRLVEYLRQETGVRITDVWLSELLRTHGYVWRRTQTTLKNLQDPKARDRAHRRIARLKKGLNTWTPTTNSGSWTRASSACTPASPTSGAPEVARSA